MSSRAALLAIDTASERMCLALVVAGRVRVHDGDGGARASATLIPTALALLADAGLGLRDLDAIAFGRGPGAFTGLRTACAVTQGFAFGAGLPVLSIDSLLIVAEDARARQGAGDDIWVAIDARMGEVYAARYRHGGERWHSVATPALYTLDALAARWSAEVPRTVAGSALDAFGTDRLPTGAARRVPSEAARAEALAALALTAWRDAPRLDAADALPLYLRDKVALTSAERAVTKAAQPERSAAKPQPAQSR